MVKGAAQRLMELVFLGMRGMEMCGDTALVMSPRSTKMVWHEIGLWWPEMRQTWVCKVASAAVECVEGRFCGRPF